jgi:peptidoglycan hydrolase-like protein with peptidoglycan-binding domain
MKRRLVAGVAGLAVVGVGVVALALNDGGGASADGSADTAAAATTTVAVERTDLVEREDLSGTIGYGDAHELGVSRQGTVTALPAAGATIERGGIVVEVDGLGVPLLYGSRPLWRPLQVDVTGPDVQILEENLVALGYATPSNLVVDETFTSATTAAVKRWQDALGMTQTGVVQPSDAVVQPGAIRVAEVLGALGAQASGPLLSVTGTERQVSIDLAATRQGLLAAGDAVEVVLPDDTRLEGAVASVGTVVTPGNDQQGTQASVKVLVTLTDPTAAVGLDQAPVSVSIVKSQATGVLAVPVEALLALAEGGYAVERVSGATSELVAVQTGAFADGRVEVIGDLAEGDEVVVPA